MEMRDRLIELISTTTVSIVDGAVSTIGSRFTPSFIKDIADHLLANGIIVPPCKVGDTVWEINTDNPFDEDLRVMEAKVERFFIGTSVDLHCMDCVGKTVFLTKEEAEKALEKGAKNEEV